VLLTMKSSYVAKCTALTPLSLLNSCKFSFPIVSLKMSSHFLVSVIHDFEQVLINVKTRKLKSKNIEGMLFLPNCSR
jgi:hypothetical protein